MTSPPPHWAVHLPPGVEPARLGLLAERSLPGAWIRRWAAAPAHPTLHDDAAGWLRAEELEQRSRDAATRLAGAGLRPGQRLVLCAATSVDLVVAYVAALRLGLVVVPVNGAYREREVAHIVADAAPAAAIVDDAEQARWITTAAADAVVTGPAVGLPPSRLPRGQAERLDTAGPADPALIVYTSGTTGAPKGAVLSHGNLLASAHALALAWRWTPRDRLVLTLPLFHLHGLGVGLHGSLTAGASIVLRPRFDVTDALDAVRTHDATMFFGVPTMYARLAASARLDELARLRLCVSGSAPLPPDVFTAVAERGGQRILERYGMTETVMNVSNPYDGERRPGTVGFPLPGVELWLEPGTDEILLRGPNVFAGYWQRPAASAESFTADGAFRSGDVGAFDDDGYLRIIGRRKELIISGGYNVYPREVEEVLREHPAVDDVAVVGLPDPEWGERVTAFVVGDSGAHDDVEVFAGQRLAAYKRPKQVRFVDDLPRNALGKVVKAQLRE